MRTLASGGRPRCSAQRVSLSRRHALMGLGVGLCSMGRLVWAQPAVPPEVQAVWPGRALRQGQMRFRWWGVSVYDAHLWRDSAQAPLTEQSYPEQGFVLELVYARRLSGAAIAERSVDEMRRLEPIEPGQASVWQAAMERVLANVQAQDRLSGWHRPGQGARFFHNGRATGEIADPTFARLFFGIWLSSRSREPALRQALLGEGG